MRGGTEKAPAAKTSQMVGTNLGFHSTDGPGAVDPLQWTDSGGTL